MEDRAADLPKLQRKAPGLTFLTAGVAALGGLLFGYDTSVISGAMLFLRNDFHLNDAQLEFAVSIALGGALVGVVLAGYCADRWGRRITLLMTGIGFALFAVWSGLASSLVTFSLARFCVGMCIGVSSLVTPLYLAELSPSAIRGALVSLNQLAITVGISVAYFVDYALAATQNWRWMFITATFPAIVLVVGMIFLPESPRWLMLVRQRDRARDVLLRLGRVADAETELDNIEQVLGQKEQGFRILTKPGFRIATLIGVGLAIFQQITGINTIIYYSPEILRMSGYPTAKAAIFAAGLIGVVNVLVTILSLVLVDRLGRRALLLLGIVGMTAALALLGLGLHTQPPDSRVLYAMIAYVVFFGIGLGPVVWLVVAEIYPTEVRGKAMSLAILAVWGANWIVAGTFLSMLRLLGPAGTFYTFAVTCVFAFIFCFALVPETKGKSLEDIERHWRVLAEKQ